MPIRDQETLIWSAFQALVTQAEARLWAQHHNAPLVRDFLKDESIRMQTVFIFNHHNHYEIFTVVRIWSQTVGADRWNRRI